MPTKDMTTATVIDPNARFPFPPSTADEIVFAGIRRDEFALGYFTGTFIAGFVHDLEVVISAADNRAISAPWVLSNDINDIFNLNGSNNDHFHIRMGRDNGGNNYLQVIQSKNGSLTFDTYNGLVFGTRYYLRVKELGGTLFLEIYSSADRTAPNLITILSISVSLAFPFIYLFPINSYKDGNTWAVSGRSGFLDTNDVVASAYYRDIINNRIGRY